ncbi:hypothetical protein HYPSUDRAFT_1070922 [Hypholoma sublateritium FD-334 SS-4]|uniref:Uncharacterized protein n=1 Tax=Hypholoma sublateritium (strain FD-334 SS-4) TaxID=945553 RepID=A0A0D2KJW3_HYPSF|nr:hypothetical protein HYPSUDRAFT_1070922 [Hypholoma sublateritium FD-334 SS-4]
MPASLPTLQVQAQRAQYPSPFRLQDLPVDIRCQIFDLLALDVPRPTTSEGSKCKEQTENREALWACAQVSSSFHHEAYSRLFNTVVLEAWLGRGRTIKPESISQLERAADMLSNSGYVVRHIKTFCLFVNSSAAFLHDFIQNGRLSQILNALHGPDHGVESLSFIVECNVRRWEYSESDQEFQLAFQDLIQSSRLKHVQLCGIAKIPVKIFHTKKIQRVELYRMGFDAEEGDISLSFSLESIGMDVPDRDEVPIALQFVSTGSKIKQIYCQVTSAHSMARVIEIAAPTSADTLKEFHVQISGTNFSNTLPLLGSPPPRQKFHFCRLVQLTSLRISEVIGAEVINVLQNFLALCSFPSLADLTLDTVIDLGHITQVHAIPHPERWNLLDQLLAQPTFKAIPKIVIVVQFNVEVNPPFDHAAYDAKVLELLYESLPEFNAARQAGSTRGVKINTVFRDVLFDVPNHSVFVRYGGRGARRIPLYPNTW